MNILIVRQQNNQLGDIICTIPMIKSLMKKYPDSNITLLAGKTNYPIPYRDLCPEINNVITLNKDTPKQYYNFIKDLRKYKFDLGIVAATLKISRTSHIVNFLSGAKIRVGVKRIDDMKNTYAFLLNIKEEFYWNRDRVHQIFRALDIIKQIGCEADEDVLNIRIKFNDEILKQANDFISQKFPRKEILIGIHSGAGKKDNIWNAENFFILAKKLHEKFDCNFIITSGNIDGETTAILTDKFISAELPFVVLENAEINFLSAVLHNMNLYITNDTGVMHLANYAGTKVISLFGPTQGYEWAPISDHSVYIQSKDSNINNITIEEVYNASINLLRK